MYINEVVFFVEFSPKAIIGPGLVLVHAGSGCSAGTRIGRNCIILMFVQLGVAGYADPSRDGPPIVGDDVVLSGGCSIYGPVTIGSRSVIGAGVRLFESVPEDSRVTARQPLTIKSINRRSMHLEPSDDDVEVATESPGSRLSRRCVEAQAMGHGHSAMPACPCDTHVKALPSLLIV